MIFTDALTHMQHGHRVTRIKWDSWDRKKYWLLGFNSIFEISKLGDRPSSEVVDSISIEDLLADDWYFVAPRGN